MDDREAAPDGRPTGLERVRGYPAQPADAGGMAALVGARLVAAEFGLVRFEAEPGPAHTNPGGTVHGGYIATLLDSALGCAALTVQPGGKHTTTLEFKMSFLRPCRPDGRTVQAEARVTQQGGRVVFTEARLADAESRLLATASSTLLVIGG